jgi:nucleotide-binding universal stress UspA family protein
MYRKIMVPLDGSAMAECVLPHVETIGRGCSAVKIVLVRVEEPVEAPAAARIRFTEKEIKEFESDKVALAQDYLDKLAAKLGYDWVQVETRVLAGPVSQQLVDYAKNNEIDLIVLATHGRSGIGRWVWGSTADRLLRYSCTPVFMVRAPGCVPGIE